MHHITYFLLLKDSKRKHYTNGLLLFTSIGVTRNNSRISSQKDRELQEITENKQKEGIKAYRTIFVFVRTWPPVSPLPVSLGPKSP